MRAMSDKEIADAVSRLGYGRGGLLFASKENRDAVARAAKARRVSTYKGSSLSLIDDHYVHDLFAADLGLGNEKSLRKVYSLTVGH